MKKALKIGAERLLFIFNKVTLVPLIILGLASAILQKFFGYLTRFFFWTITGEWDMEGVLNDFKKGL